MPKHARKLTLRDGRFNSSLTPRQRAACLIYGAPGEGKTTFAARYAPDPLVFINFDGRASRRVAEAQGKGREIHYVEIPHPGNLSGMSSQKAKQLGKEALDEAFLHMDIAVQEGERGKIRTCCIDTGTELTDIMKLAVTGTVERVPDDYGRSKGLVNEYWRSLIHMSRDAKMNLIVLARAKEVWRGGRPTGKFIPRGVDVPQEDLDWSGNIRLAERGKERWFEIEVRKSGENIDEQGEVYTEMDWEEFGGPFAYSCWMQYGGEPEDWQ